MLRPACRRTTHTVRRFSIFVGRSEAGRAGLRGWPATQHLANAGKYLISILGTFVVASIQFEKHYNRATGDVRHLRECRAGRECGSRESRLVRFGEEKHESMWGKEGMVALAEEPPSNTTPRLMFRPAPPAMEPPPTSLSPVFPFPLARRPLKSGTA